MLTDSRYISLRQAIRDALIEAHINTLPPPPTGELSIEELEQRAREKQDRERREGALAERQRQVQEEKRKQQGALRQGRGLLREGEYELDQAMNVGRQGLLTHMNVDEVADE